MRVNLVWVLQFNETCKHIIDQCTHIAHGMDCTAEMSAMVDQRVSPAPDTKATISVSQSKMHMILLIILVWTSQHQT